MNDVTAEIVYQSLGSLLAEISNSGEVESSVKLAEKVGNALKFHQELKKELDALTNENRMLKNKMRLASVNGCVEERTGVFQQYEEMKRKGAKIEEIFAQTQLQNLDKLNTLRVLRQVFDLSLDKANKILQENEAVKQAA